MKKRSLCLIFSFCLILCLFIPIFSFSSSAVLITDTDFSGSYVSSPRLALGASPSDNLLNFTQKGSASNGWSSLTPNRYYTGLHIYSSTLYNAFSSSGVSIGSISQGSVSNFHGTSSNYFVGFAFSVSSSTTYYFTGTVTSGTCYFEITWFSSSWSPIKSEYFHDGESLVSPVNSSYATLILYNSPANQNTSVINLYLGPTNPNPDPEPPPTLNAPSLSYSSNGSLSWSAVPNATSYAIEYARTSDAEAWMWVNNVTSPVDLLQFFIDGYRPLYYHVYALADGYERNYSSFALVGTIASPVLRIEGDSLWADYSGSQNVDIDIYKDGSFYRTLTYPIDSFHLTEEGTYTCRAYVHGSSDDLYWYPSNLSSPLVYSFSPSVLDSPALSVDHLTVSWDSVDGADDYVLNVATDSLFSDIISTEVLLTTSYDVDAAGLYVRVKARGSGYTDSVWSNVVQTYIDPPSVIELTPPVLSYSNGVLSWSTPDSDLGVSYVVVMGQNTPVYSGQNNSFEVGLSGTYYVFSYLSGSRSDPSNTITVELLESESDAYYRGYEQGQKDIQGLILVINALWAGFVTAFDLFTANASIGGITLMSILISLCIIAVVAFVIKLIAKG